MTSGKILVTGCAGFIGSNLVDKLLPEKYQVIGIDNFNDYYDPKIKEKNISFALKFKNFKLYKVDILEYSSLQEIFKKENPQKVIHLAARAGVRPSIKNPSLYANVNVLGTINLLRSSVDFKVKQFIFGSSSSVYGNSKRLPFGEDDLCQEIASPYGSSKRSAELFVEAFNHSYGLGSVILRFFTVYGPRGRPDMAPALFAKAILKGNKLIRFGDGLTSRDYTYIDDVVEGIMQTINENFSFEIINLGSSNPVTLAKFIAEVEKIIGKKARIEELPIQEGDVGKTWANIVKAEKLLGWRPKTKLTDGLGKYVEWLKGQN